MSPRLVRPSYRSAASARSTSTPSVMLVVDTAVGVTVIGAPYDARIGADATETSPTALVPPPPPLWASTYAFVVASSDSVGAPTFSRPPEVRKATVLAFGGVP